MAPQIVPAEPGFDSSRHGFLSFNGLALGATVFDPALDVGLRLGISGKPGGHDVPERLVGLTVPAAVESVAFVLAARGVEG